MYIIDLGIYDFYINVHIFIKIISLIFLYCKLRLPRLRFLFQIMYYSECNTLHDVNYM